MMVERFDDGPIQLSKPEVPTLVLHSGISAAKLASVKEAPPSALFPQPAASSRTRC